MTIAIRKPSLGSAATAFLSKHHKLLIDGKWVDAKSGKTFAVEDPATEEVITHVPAGDKADIDAAVAAARRAFETGPWSRILPGERSRLVWRQWLLPALRTAAHPSVVRGCRADEFRSRGGSKLA